MTSERFRWVKTVGRFLRGDEGSISWVIEMTVMTVKQVLDAVNSFLRARRSERAVKQVTQSE